MPNARDQIAKALRSTPHYPTPGTHADAVVALGETRWLCSSCHQWGDRKPPESPHYYADRPCPGTPRRVLVLPDDPEEA